MSGQPVYVNNLVINKVNGVTIPPSAWANLSALTSFSTDSSVEFGSLTADIVIPNTLTSGGSVITASSLSKLSGLDQELSTNSSVEFGSLKINGQTPSFGDNGIQTAYLDMNGYSVINANNINTATINSKVPVYTTDVRSTDLNMNTHAITDVTNLTVSGNINTTTINTKTPMYTISSSNLDMNSKNITNVNSLNFSGGTITGLTTINGDPYSPGISIPNITYVTSAQQLSSITSGVYVICGNITLSADTNINITNMNVSFIGYGKDISSITFSQSSTTSTLTCINIYNTSNVVIKNLTLKCSQDTKNNINCINNTGSNVAYKQTLTISGSRIRGFLGPHLIYLDDIETFYCTDTVFEYNKPTTSYIHIILVHEIYFYENRFTNPNVVGLTTYGIIPYINIVSSTSKIVNISNNTFYLYLTGIGIKLVTNIDSVNISGNTFNNEGDSTTPIESGNYNSYIIKDNCGYSTILTTPYINAVSTTINSDATLCDTTYKQIVYNGITNLDSNLFDISNVGILTYKGSYDRLINISATFIYSTTMIGLIGLFKGTNNITPLNYIATSNTISGVSSVFLTSIVSASYNDTFRFRVSQLSSQFTCKFVSISAYAI